MALCVCLRLWRAEMIYAKRLNGKQRAWMKRYEDETGIEPLYQEQLDSKEMAFLEVAWENCRWYEEHSSDALLRITDHIPGE